MIATLEGTVDEKVDASVIVNVGGVGYGVFVVAEDQASLEVGQTAKLYVYEHIREAIHDLFGFTNRHTKNLFELLLTVNGVGPRMALNVLSIGTSDEVKSAIAAGDTKFIQGASGVGKRVAERVIVDLKDKVGLVGVELSATGLLQSEALLIQDEAIEALVSLGYSPVDAAKALEGFDASLPTEERVKRALKA